MELKDRVREARRRAGLTQGELVERVVHLPGVESFSQQALTKLETGASKKSAYLAHIAYVCGVDATWLATGMGDMVVSHAIREANPAYPARLIADTERLDPEIRDQVKKLIAGLERREISKDRFMAAMALLFPEKNNNAPR